MDVVRGEIVKAADRSDRQWTELPLSVEPATIEIPPAAVRVDGRDRYLIPGLVDMHVHLFNNASHRAPNEWAFPLFVANGVTGVREMRTEPEGDGGGGGLAHKGKREASWSLHACWQRAWPSVQRSVEPDRGGRCARPRHVGADFIKIFSEVREPQWRAILDEARSLRMPVCGHIPAEVSLLEAATAGQRSNEHLTQVYEACSAQGKGMARCAKEGDGHRSSVKLREAQERGGAGEFRSTHL